ncbi:helix-turn-helix domain-containing protein [Caldimonas sp. KR1-144]|uniref:helix-turn-helix domain-containing protein n=1 Tax=Caldimonas sp. KR1-144 TaxID=3400911 RepID=UPI003C01DFF1
MTSSSSHAASPAGPFFATRAQRIALARERFFEDGVRPSGLVSEAVIQSWSRCLGARMRPSEPIGFEMVTRARAHSAITRSRALLQAADGELAQLEAVLAGTGCRALLTDRDGVVVHVTRCADADPHSALSVASRVGVDLGEARLGTNAPGLVARSGEAVTVLGAEHFFSSVTPFFCAAAPIRNVSGEVVGVLDVTREGEPFRFDAASLIATHAAGIENRLLIAQTRDAVLLRFSTVAPLLHTPYEGLAAIGADGHIAWVNAAGAALVGNARQSPIGRCVEEVFGLDLGRVLALAGSPASPHRLPSGLGLWLESQPTGEAAPRRVAVTMGLPAPAPTAEPVAQAPEPERPAASLHDANRVLIERTLAACGGNVSRAARQLGVSRGLLYRRLRQSFDANEA